MEERATLVLGSDVLYLPGSSAPLLRMVDALLEDGGVAFIADPCRPAGDDLERLVGEMRAGRLVLHATHRASFVTTGDGRRAVRALRVFELHTRGAPPARPWALERAIAWMQRHRAASDADPASGGDLFNPDLYHEKTRPPHAADDQLEEW